jgi:hypothetical protein
MSPALPNPCPLCGGTLENFRQLTICAGCHGNLLISSSAVVSTTAEFAAVSDAAAEAALSGGDVETRPTRSCTWCGKSGAAVKKLLQSATGASICNECVAFCSDVMAAELGDDWR